ncbi:MAG: hypothetical protein Q7N87_01900 [Candidatus Uhrbacteria bacterium]|nr:hypothetical protein [Candidatus Uhrbacteria bacterium]
MKNVYFILFSLILFGAGCAQSKNVAPKLPSASEPVYATQADIARLNNLEDKGENCSNINSHLRMDAKPVWTRVTIPQAQVSLEVPYSSDWMIDDKRVKEFDQRESSIHFGPYTTFEACGVIRPLYFSWKKQVSLDELAKRNEDKTKPAQKIKVGSWDAVIYSETGLCDSQNLAVNVKDKTFIISHACGDVTDEDKYIAASIRF